MARWLQSHWTNITFRSHYFHMSVVMFCITTHCCIQESQKSWALHVALPLSGLFCGQGIQESVQVHVRRLQLKQGPDEGNVFRRILRINAGSQAGVKHRDASDALDKCVPQDNRKVRTLPTPILSQTLEASGWVSRFRYHLRRHNTHTVIDKQKTHNKNVKETRIEQHRLT